MAPNKRTPFEREHDLMRTAELYLRGKSQSEIARVIGVDRSQISYDLKVIRKRWQQSSMVDLNEVKQRELARIDALEREYWQAWEQSKQETVKTTSSQSDKDGGRVSVTREQHTGNAAFLAGIQWCIEQRCKIFGIYEATKISLDWRKALEEQGYSAGDIYEELVSTLTRTIDPDAD